jgi:hypothetical protein
MGKFLLMLVLFSLRPDAVHLPGGMINGTLRTSDGAPNVELDALDYSFVAA